MHGIHECEQHTCVSMVGEQGVPGHVEYNGPPHGFKLEGCKSVRVSQSIQYTARPRED